MSDFKIGIYSNVTMVSEILAIAEVTSFMENKKLENLLGNDLTFKVLFKSLDNRIINKLPAYHGVLWDKEPNLKFNENLTLIFQIKFENFEYLAKFMEDFSML